MQTLKPFEYLFYRIYDWNLKTWGKADVPQFNALFAVSFLLLANIYVIIDLVRLIINVDFPFRFEHAAIPAAISYTVLVVINFFLLVHNHKYEKIADQFRCESEVSRRINLACCLLYVVLTFVCAFGLPYLHG